MIAETIFVGTELLMGQILNSNAQYLAQQFAALGIDHYYEVTVGDNMARLEGAIKVALSRADVLILTGGLGPTEDDLTKYAVAEVLGLKVVQDAAARAHLEGYFGRLGREMTPNNYRQSEFPEGSTILPNDRGTAPGCMVETDGKAIFILPGPPGEMQPMFERSVKEYLQQRSGVLLHSRMLQVFGVGESSLEHMLKDIIDAQVNPTLATYATAGQVSLRVTAQCATEEEGEKIMAPVVQEIQARLGDALYSLEGESLDEVVSRLLDTTHATLAVAESLTGGSVCAKLVSQPGMSKHLLEGAVAYTVEAKKRLGVNPDTLERYGTVSEQTALEMARAVRKRADADVGIATTGVAGPEPSEGHEPGLFYVALVGREGMEMCKKFTYGGNRQRIRLLGTLNAINLLRLHLMRLD